MSHLKGRPLKWPLKFIEIHEIKRHFLLRRKAMTNLDSILKSRDITLSTKVYLVKAMVFPVIMYGYEIWTIKKAECWRIDASELWCWRRLLRVPWTTRRSNQSILKEINPEYSLEGLILKLKLQYFGHLMWRADSFEKTLMLGKIEGGGEGDDRAWDGWMHHWLDGHEFEQALGVDDRQESPPCCSPWGQKKSRTRLSNWTDTHAKMMPGEPALLQSLHTEFGWMYHLLLVHRIR